jgi:HEAT repeat protein
MLRKTLIAVMTFLAVGCSDNSNRLLKELDSDNPRVRTRAATTLMRNRDPKVTAKLIGLLKSDKERLVYLSAQVLGSLSDTTAIAPLGKLLEHPNPYVRESAVWSLGTIGDESALPIIEKALSDSASGVRHSAVSALANLMYSPAAKLAFNMLRDDVDSVRAAAVKTLYFYRDKKDAGILAADFAVPLTDNSELVRFVTVQALGYAYPDSELGGKLLMDSLKDTSKYVRVEVITSLNKIKCKEAVPLLKKMYETSTVDEELAIAEAIKNITGETFPPDESLGNTNTKQ